MAEHLLWWCTKRLEISRLILPWCSFWCYISAWNIKTCACNICFCFSWMHVIIFVVWRKPEFRQQVFEARAIHFSALPRRISNFRHRFETRHSMDTIFFFVQHSCLKPILRLMEPQRLAFNVACLYMPQPTGKHSRWTTHDFLLNNFAVIRLFLLVMFKQKLAAC